MANSARLEISLEFSPKESRVAPIMTWGIFFALFWMLLGVVAFLYLLKAKDAA